MNQVTLGCRWFAFFTYVCIGSIVWTPGYYHLTRQADKQRYMRDIRDSETSEPKFRNAGCGCSRACKNRNQTRILDAPAVNIGREYPLHIATFAPDPIYPPDPITRLC